MDITAWIGAIAAVATLGVALLAILWKQAQTSGKLNAMLERHEEFHGAHFNTRDRHDVRLNDHDRQLAVHTHRLDNQ